MKKSTITDMALAALFAALIAAGAFIKIPIPGIPFTLQVLFTTLAGLLLGAKVGALSVGVYIAVGLMGLPIFSAGGGISYIFNPTFGYLVGFFVGTYVTGKIAHAVAAPSVKRLMVASFVGLAVIYLLGMIYYYFMVNFYLDSEISIQSLFLYCFALTVPGDIVSCIFCSFLCKRLIPILKKGR